MGKPLTIETNNIAAVMEINQAKRILANINWNFSTPFSVGRSGVRFFDCRKYHWYPATFIPEIPYTIIEILTKPGAVVYDPFAGIGTTIFQALLLGRKPFATEICRVAVRFMRSLWILLSSRTNISLVEKDLNNVRASYNTNEDYSRIMEGSPIKIECLRPWFTLKTFNQLMYLAFCEQKLRNPGSKAAMSIILSATLKTVCSQDKGWGCIADNMLPKSYQLNKEKNALERFDRNLTILLRDILKVKKTLPSIAQLILSSVEPDSSIVQIDVRDGTYIPDESVDLIVTSPPYPNMTDYSTSQRLSYYWLGVNPMDDIPYEIGARRKRFMATSLREYRDAMKIAIEVFAKKLKPNGYACLVMPTFNTDRQNNSVRRQAVQECLAFFSNCGFVLEQELNRILPIRRRHHNQKWTSLEREAIYLYRKVS